jgi:hypothetical protein
MDTQICEAGATLAPPAFRFCRVAREDEERVCSFRFIDDNQ